MNRAILIATVTTLLTAAARADNWPAWRGPHGNGHCDEKNLPLKWSPTENVKWKGPLPDAGNSTPIVWGDRIFLTQASEKTVWPPKGGNGGQAAAQKRSLLCLSRADGKLLWRQDVEYKEPEYTHPTNPFCSASPVTDGKIVIAFFGSAGLYCWDYSGKLLWKKDTGKIEHIWGDASSPVLYGDLCIQYVGPGESTYLLAVNKNTGEAVWKHEEGGASGVKSKDWVGSWSTPIFAKIDGADQLLLSVPKAVKAFDPAKGTVIWSCGGLSNLVYTSAVYSDGVVVAMSGFHGHAMACKAGGTGDTTAASRLWHKTAQNPQRIGTGTIVNGKLYMLAEPGTPHCFDIKTGEELWKVTERPAGGCWSSMVYADGRLYCVDLGGTTVVLKAEPKYEVLSTNRLGERTLSSIAVSDGEIFIRTYRNLWCISGRK